MAFDDYLGAERARMQSQTQPQAPAYMFRDDRNAALDREQKAQAAAPAAGPFAPAKPGTGFDTFSKDLEAGAPAAKAPGSNPFAPADTKGMVSGAISRLLSNPTGGFDQQTTLAREAAIKKDQQANEDLRTQAALQFLPGTGQNIAPIQQQTDAQRLAMRDFDLSAAAGHAKAEQEGLQTGAALGLQQEGQHLSAEQAARQLAESQRQFNETLPIQAAQAKAAADLGLAGLDLEKTKVANQANQFNTSLNFQATQADIDRKWKTGERLSSQDFTTLINKSSQEFEAAQSALNRALQEKLQGNSQAFEAAQTAAAQAFTQAMQERSLSHEEAMAASQQVFAKTMQAAGFDHDTAMQVAQLAQQANLAKQQMDLQETMHIADLAQSDRQFGQRLGLDYQQLDQQKEQFLANFNQQADQFEKEFGLKSEQVKQALASKDVEDALQRVTIGLELTKNNPDAMKPFAQQLARTMGKALGFSDAQIEAGIKDGSLTSFAGGSGSSTGSTSIATAPTANNDTVQAGMDSLASEVGKLNSGVKVETLRPHIQNLSQWWNEGGKAALTKNLHDPYAISVVTEDLAPLIQAGMTPDAVKRAVPWLPASVIDLALSNAGLAPAPAAKDPTAGMTVAPTDVSGMYGLAGWRFP